MAIPYTKYICNPRELRIYAQFRNMKYYNPCQEKLDHREVTGVGATDDKEKLKKQHYNKQKILAGTVYERRLQGGIFAPCCMGRGIGRVLHRGLNKGRGLASLTNEPKIRQLP